jgi:hypothetical protein
MLSCFILIPVTGNYYQMTIPIFFSSCLLVLYHYTLIGNYIPHQLTFTLVTKIQMVKTWFKHFNCPNSIVAFPILSFFFLLSCALPVIKKAIRISVAKIFLMFINLVI